MDLSRLVRLILQAHTSTGCCSSHESCSWQHVLPQRGMCRLDSFHEFTEPGSHGHLMNQTNSHLSMIATSWNHSDTSIGLLHLATHCCQSFLHCLHGFHMPGIGSSSEGDARSSQSARETVEKVMEYGLSASPAFLVESPANHALLCTHLTDSSPSAFQKRMSESPRLQTMRASASVRQLFCRTWPSHLANT